MTASDLLRSAVARSGTIREVVIEPDALSALPRVAEEQVPGAALLIVADPNTWAAAGEAALARLRGAGRDAKAHILDDPRPAPTVEASEAIGGALDGRVPMAVGSGVLNDLVRHAAFAADRSFLSVATAASMDGYASAGAPLSRGGFKKTIPARAPVAVVADTTVIGAAPPAMSGWGYGDLAGKAPAGGDWMIADALGVEARDDAAWPLVQDNLPRWLADPAGVARGEAAAVGKLFEGLILSGLAMEFHGTSRPASGADHQIAHMWEMEGLTHCGAKVSHGACVSVGTLAVLRLYDWLLDHDLSALDPRARAAEAPDLAAERRMIDATLPDALAARAVEETAAKHVAGAALRDRLDRLCAVWPDLRRALRDHLPRHGAMRHDLRAAGAPSTPEDIGVSPTHLRDTVRAARFIRSRYTVLDLLAEAGLLDAAVDEALADEAWRTPA